MMAINMGQRDGIRCVSGFVMDGGDLTITATGIQEDDEGRGIKVDGREHSSYHGEGFALIQGGRLTITSVGKAITAGWEAEDDAETDATGDDSNADVTVNGGILDIVTTGIPYERMQGDGPLISCSPEGIEAKNALTINGGVVTAIGAMGAETAIDSDTFNFEVNGGLLVGLGGGNISLPSNASRQHILIVHDRVARGKTLELRQEDGVVVFSYLVPASYQVMVISCPGLDIGKEYTVYSDGNPMSSAIIGEGATQEGSAVTFFGGMGRWRSF